MTTDEMILELRENAKQAYPLAISQLLNEAADRLEEQEKIINQYHRADTFLNAHGWKWEDVADDN